MAYSNCVKCNNSSFEMVEASPSKSNFKLMFIQCARCGGVVGVVDYYNIGNLIYKLAKKLKIDLDQ
jgi:excinuclease UvrABC ATPase subunit